MKFASRLCAHPDGELLIVSRDGQQAVPATAIAPHLIDALQRWAEVQGPLQALSDALNAGTAPGAAAFDPATSAPLQLDWRAIGCGPGAMPAHGRQFRPAAPASRRC